MFARRHHVTFAQVTLAHVLRLPLEALAINTYPTAEKSVNNVGAQSLKRDSVLHGLLQVRPGDEESRLQGVSVDTRHTAGVASDRAYVGLPDAHVAVVAVVAGLPVYVRPQVDPLRHADAILILGGPDYRRYTFGLDPGAQDWAPNVVVSNPKGTDDAWLTRLCAPPQAGFDLHCFIPDPPSTKGEGRELRRLVRNMAGGQSSLSRCGPIFPGPDSSWNSASTVTW